MGGGGIFSLCMRIGTCYKLGSFLLQNGYFLQKWVVYYYKMDTFF